LKKVLVQHIKTLDGVDGCDINPLSRIREKNNGIDWKAVTNTFLKQLKQHLLAENPNQNLDAMSWKRTKFQVYNHAIIAFVKDLRPSSESSSSSDAAADPESGMQPTSSKWNVTKHPWTQEENNLLIQNVQQLGHKWHLMKSDFPYRSTMEVALHYWENLYPRLSSSKNNGAVVSSKKESSTNNTASQSSAASGSFIEPTQRFISTLGIPWTPEEDSVRIATIR
jgi:hypothetical protein